MYVHIYIYTSLSLYIYIYTYIYVYILLCNETNGMCLYITYYSGKSYIVQENSVLYYK